LGNGSAFKLRLFLILLYHNNLDFHPVFWRCENSSRSFPHPLLVRWIWLFNLVNINAVKSQFANILGKHKLVLWIEILKNRRHHWLKTNSRETNFGSNKQEVQKIEGLRNQDSTVYMCFQRWTSVAREFQIIVEIAVWKLKVSMNFVYKFQLLLWLKLFYYFDENLWPHTKLTPMAFHFRMEFCLPAVC